MCNMKKFLLIVFFSRRESEISPVFPQMESLIFWISVNLIHRFCHSDSATLKNKINFPPTFCWLFLNYYQTRSFIILTLSFSPLNFKEKNLPPPRHPLPPELAAAPSPGPRGRFDPVCAHAEEELSLFPPVFGRFLSPEICRLPSQRRF